MFRSILVPIDTSDQQSWRKALPVAISLAGTMQAKLHLLTVLPGFGLPMVGQYFPDDYQAKVREQAAGQLDELARAQVPDPAACQRLVVEGKIYQEILKASDALGIDLIVMGSHRAELEDFLLGPNAARVVRHATCSVMVVRE